MNTHRLTALAVGAHPDDIEFHMVGTLLLLKEAGADIHMWNLANGGCGTMVYSYDQIVRMRWEEAQESAREAGASIYPPLVDDLSLFYTAEMIARVAAVIRRVKPDIILTHPPLDYMEDHMNTCRLVVTGAFARGMPNFATHPPEATLDGRDGYLPCHAARPARWAAPACPPGVYVDIGAVLARKRSLLAKHRSQKEWLDASQGMDSFLVEMEDAGRIVGQRSGRFEYAEGWRRHLHLGLAAPEADPLRAALGDRCWRRSGSHS